MAITFVNAGTSGDNGAVGSGNPTAPGIPAGMAAGDFMLLVVHSCDNVTTSTPLGWTLKQAQNAGTALRQTIFWRRWITGDTAPTIAHAAGDACQARIYGFRGINVSLPDPIEAIATQTGTATSTATAASITIVNGDAAVVGAWAEEVTGNTSGAPTWASYSGTNPAFVEIGDNGVDNLNANELGVGVAWGTATPAGTVTGTRTAVVSTPAATPTNVIGTLLALTPDVPGGGAGQNFMLPLTGLAIPGQPAVAPPLGPASGSDRSAFDVITPLPLSRFFNPLSLALGLKLPAWAAPIIPAATDVTYTDTASGTITLSGTNTESHSHSSSPSGTITLSGSASESQSHSSSPSGTITLSGSVSQSFSHSASVTGTITLSGSATNLLVYSDSVSGAITLSGSATQSLSASDTRSGTITLSGSNSENFQPPGVTGIDNKLLVDPNVSQHILTGVR